MRKPSILFSQVPEATLDAAILWEGDNLLSGEALKQEQSLVRRLKLECDFTPFSFLSVLCAMETNKN